MNIPATIKWAWKQPLVRNTAMSLAGYAIQTVVKDFRNFKKNRVKNAEIQVDSWDGSFPKVVAWVHTLGVLKESNVVKLSDKTRKIADTVDDDSSIGVGMTIPHGTHPGMWNGKRIIIKFERQTEQDDYHDYVSIIVVNGNRTDIKKIIQEIDAINQLDTGIDIKGYDHGYWSRVSNRSPRPEHTYILKKGQKERIFEDIDWFFKNKEWYVNKGIPYHRGYCFSGPPGTGKTTMISVLASKFKKPVCIINLSSIQSDAELIKCVSTAPAGSFIALEDVDCIIATHKRKEDDDTQLKGITLAGLLNALDGVQTPDGVIFILTTNFPDKLDPALLRPGRIDVNETVGFLDKEEQYELSRLFYDVNVGVDKPLGAANLQQVFMRNLTDPEQAQKEVEAL